MGLETLGQASVTSWHLYFACLPDQYHMDNIVWFCYQLEMQSGPHPMTAAGAVHAFVAEPETHVLGWLFSSSSYSLLAHVGGFHGHGTLSAFISFLCHAGSCGNCTELLCPAFILSTTSNILCLLSLPNYTFCLIFLFSFSLLLTIDLGIMISNRNIS